MSGTHPAVAFASGLLLVACAGTDPAGSAAAASTEGEPPIRTSAQSYELREEGEGLATEIPIRFENRTGRTVYIVNCRGALAPVLEKRVDGRWEAYWSPALLMCLSPPIVIEAGEALERTIHVWGALQAGSVAPSFRDADVEGTYRLVLGGMVWNYDDGRPGFGDPVPLEHRVSNTFTLER